MSTAKRCLSGQPGPSTGTSTVPAHNPTYARARATVSVTCAAAHASTGPESTLIRPRVPAAAHPCAAHDGGDPCRHEFPAVLRSLGDSFD